MRPENIYHIDSRYFLSNAYGSGQYTYNLKTSNLEEIPYKYGWNNKELKNLNPICKIECHFLYLKH